MSCELADTCPPNVDSIKQLLLDMAQQRSVQAALSLVVDRIASQVDIALARIWLVGPGDICGDCHMRDQCPHQTSCLHLVASAGRSIVRDEVWNGLNGSFRRFPFGIRKIGDG